MSSSEKHLPQLDEEVLDRLVDGELGESQRRELLASLDSRPDGWRRCALAFLQAQCWEKELGGMLRSSQQRLLKTGTGASQPAEIAASSGERLGASPISSQARSVEPAAAGRPSGRRFDFRRLGTPLAVAASLLFALVIGTQIRLGSTPKPGDEQVAGGGQTSLAPIPARPKPKGSGPWEMVTLAGTGSPGREVRLPARQGDRWNEDWMDSTRPAIPDDMLEAIRRQGGKVRHSWQFVPMPLEDGRRVVVPIDQFDVHYPDYQ